MRIVFTLASLGPGGAERVVSLLANKMDGMGHQVEIVCLKFNDVYYQTNDNVKVTLAMQQTTNHLTELFWLRKHIKQEKPDVVIAFTEGVYCFTIAALLGTKIPVIASERLDPACMSWQRNLLKKILLPHASWLVVQTEYIKRYFKGKVGRMTSIILNPVNEKVFKLPTGKKENIIISVARLYPQKNQAMLIEAFAKIAPEFPQWRLVIYGEGPERAELESKICLLQLKDRVSLPGRCQTVIEEMNKAKVFALSSDYEGMSNAMIEAVCVGLPIVSTHVSGTEELVKEGMNGYVVEKSDVESMTKAFERLMGNEQLLESFGAESKRMAEQFRLDTVVNEWLKLIDNVTKNNG